MSSAAEAPRPISSAGQKIAGAADPLVKFESTRHMTFRPVVFRPNGSFRVLKESGKLRCEAHEEAVYRGRTRNELADSAHFVPGYTGFVRGKQHIAGRTYGDATRRALTEDYRAIVTQSPVPSSPQNNRHVHQKNGQFTYGTGQLDNRVYHIPGYTGFVPGVRQTFGKGYGSATTDELSKSHCHTAFSATKSGFAETALRRHATKLDSNPLPGGSVTNEPPEMFVPSHVRYLRYMN